MAMDAPFHSKSGHQGTAMALAPLAHTLYSRIMCHDPADPKWPNRDRFILSAGHASILQYTLLWLNGYGVEVDDLRAFRQLGSITPGHPEVGHTEGVEVTTGPLGQGFANAVGMAIAEAHLRATLGEEVIDHHVFVIVGDGCLMEGVSHEAASLAGHLGLERLICIFDDNKITIDGATDLTCSDDVAGRFRSYGWNVIEAGPISEDCDALEAVISRAKHTKEAPTLIVLPTQIGFPSPDFTAEHAAHGNPLVAEHISRAKAVLGIPDEPFYAPQDLVSAYRAHAKRRCKPARDTWMASGAEAHLASHERTGLSARLAPVLPRFDSSESPATRAAIQKVLAAATEVLPNIIAGAADLTGNTGARLSPDRAFSRADRTGRQIYFGVREHAMGAVANGIALHGNLVPVVGTFFVFADYMRPAVRLAALSKAKVVFVFSHDSVGVGEDGPTHQPVEHLASLRVVPGLQVIRPADGNETAAAMIAALDYDGPSALVLSRQNLPIVTDGRAVARGAGIVSDAPAPRVVLVGTGSELSLCVAASKELAAAGIASRVVSMPCQATFLAQDAAFRESVLPSGIPVVSVEAGSAFGWSAIADRAIGIDEFGASAPGTVALEHFGMSVPNVVRVASELTSS
jgi:transketolase